jgi:predicted nucleotidyltransferase
MTDFAQLIPLLVKGGVRFILVGGAAATAHGSARLTQDLDIVYERTRENVARLTRVLAPLNPYLRGEPPGLPFLWSESTLLAGLNFTLVTSLGSLDLLSEIAGGGGYKELLTNTITLQLFGVECLCLDLPKLIQVKRAAGRPRDLEVVAELQALLEEQEQG